MDDLLQARIREMARQLAVQEKGTLRGARTLLELENLTVEIGDELVRQLATLDLEARSDETAAQPEHPCPDCGRVCTVQSDREPLILQGRRGEIEYSEPRCHCRSCRRDFFPDGAATGATGAGDRHPGTHAKGRVVGSESGKLSAGERRPRNARGH